jgi:ATP-dependent RNA helicase RhlE
MSFTTLGLRAELLGQIARQGYTSPTPIQSQAIPVVFAGRDLLAKAQTGTGKTAAFALPIVQILAEKTPAAKHRTPRTLVLVPTRELAAQVSQHLQTYGRCLGLRSTMVYGGVNIQPQIERLQRGVDIVVATPGRLLDHAERGTISLAAVEVLVLDEADRMLDLGFIDDILKVAEYLPATRQTLLFSATYASNIKKLATTLLKQPQRVEVAGRTLAADEVIQQVYAVERSRKRDVISHLLRKNNWPQVLVFTRTRYSADKLTAELQFDGLQAAALHSNKSQSLRTRTLGQFKRGELRVLVATDVAARGLDIQHLPCVINYELPQVAEDYVHRIGRTGRAGAGGLAISLVGSTELPRLAAIEKLLKSALTRETIEDMPQIPMKRGTMARPRKTTPGVSRGKKAVEKTPKVAAKPKKKQKSQKRRTLAARKTTPPSAVKTGRRGARS